MQKLSNNKYKITTLQHATSHINDLLVHNLEVLM